MKAFTNFSEVPPNATQDDIERVREGAHGQYISRSRSTSFGEQPSSGYGRKPPSLSSHNVATFPTKLHKILSEPRYQHIIRWLPHGRSWEVVDQNTFMKDVVPHFFSFSKYASFTRQITGWNFIRKGTGPDRGSYYHELFLRGRPHLVKFMKREVTGQMKVKPPSANDSGRKGNDSSWDEPDLFELSKKCPVRGSSSDDRRTSVALSAGTDESQQQFVSQAGTNQHRHLPAVENGYRSSNSATVHHPAGHHYVHHHNGYQQWAASGASHSNHYPPPAHYYAQPIPVQQGQEPIQYSEQERYSEHCLHEQHRSSFLFNAPPLSHSHSHYGSSGTHYFGQQQGHQNQNAAHPPWQSYSDWEQHRNHHHQQQQQQQHRDNGHNRAWGTTQKMHGGPTSTSDHNEYPAEQQATLNDGNLEAGPGPAGQQNDTEVSPLPLQFQPPSGSRTKDLSLNHDHLPTLDEEQRTALLGILGTAVDGNSPSTTGNMENDGKDNDANGDCNSVDNDDDKGNTDASEDDADIDVSPIKLSSNSD